MATIDSRSATTRPTAATVQAVTDLAQPMPEWRFAAAVIAITLIVTSLPFVFAYATTPPDKQFMGIMVNVNDHIQYFSWMRDLSTSFQASNRLTPEPNDPVYFNLLWWGLGHFGALTGLDYAGLFSLLRLLAVIVSLGSAYAFLRIAMPDPTQRKLAFVLIAFGGGGGVVWIAVKHLFNPGDDLNLLLFDVYTTEPNTFFQLLAFPHFAMALGLLVATFGLVLIALRTRRLRYAVAAGIVGLILGLQHAYDLVTIYGVLGLYGVLMWLRDRKFPTFLFWCGVIVVGLSMPPAAYSFLLVTANPIWREVFAQFDLAGAFTPAPWHLPILLGIPFLLALIVFRPRTILQSRSETEVFIGAWFLAHFALVYLPIDFQIHLLLGWQIPIAILAARALVTFVVPALACRTRLSARALTIGLVAASVITNVYLFTWRFYDLSRHGSPYYLSKDEISALNWLAEHTNSSDVVLATLDFGQYVPVWTNARAFLAHWTGTIDYPSKVEMVDTVLSADSTDAERLAILTEFDVTYLVISPGYSRSTQLERPRGIEPADSPYVTPAFTQGQVTIYRVQTAWRP